VSSFIVEAGNICPPALFAYRVSPRVRETTIAPHVPLFTRPVSPPSDDARSAALLGAVYLMTGGRGAFLRAVRRLLLVVLFLVCESTMVGLARQSESATSVSVRI
jgi:hypothetical protein